MFNTTINNLLNELNTNITNNTSDTLNNCNFSIFKNIVLFVSFVLSSYLCVYICYCPSEQEEEETSNDAFLRVTATCL